VSNFPSPVAGFNTNVAYRGSVFHLQTEDSGAKNPRIVTHLFGDGGRILRTLRIDYKEHLGRPDLQVFVRSLMRAQHKNLFLSLRAGELDTLIEQACGPFLQAPPRQSSSQLSLPPELSTLTTTRASVPDRRPSDRPSSEETSAVHELRIPEIVRERRDSAPAPRQSGEVTVVSPKPPGARKSEPPRKMAVGGEHPPRMRPVASATLPVAPPPTRRASGAISEQSLDDVILSCLDDELDGSRRG
jgi:hypothetical protein